jgi:hypothetical protein
MSRVVVHVDVPMLTRGDVIRPSVDARVVVFNRTCISSKDDAATRRRARLRVHWRWFLP